MLKSFFSIATIFVAFLCFSVSESIAQIPSGSFGMGATFTAGSPAIDIRYAINNKLEVGLGLGYNSASVERTNSTDDTKEVIISYGVIASYYFGDANAIINPWLGLNFSFSERDRDNGDVEESLMNLQLLFGAQAMLVKNVYLRAGLGLAYQTQNLKGSDMGYERDITIFSLSTSQIGVIFYF